MLLLQSQGELTNWRKSIPQEGLHFVPTMGALHGGHRQLIQRAARARWWGQPHVLVSVFVNPLQFGAGEDFDRYPRKLEEDGHVASEAGAHALFAPAIEEIYPQGEAGVTHVLPPENLLKTLCAAQRPGHFGGVATVITRLLAIIRPERLFLGEKDWQQLVILRKVVADLGLPVVVEGMATVRQQDGLALSSRNGYLSPQELTLAAGLPLALARAANLAKRGETPDTILRDLREDLQHRNLPPDYVALVDAHTLAPLEKPGELSLLAVAVRCGPARLIDHLFLMPRAPIVAIDGPAGAGKSTVSRALAERLGLTFLDTGAMYRALTWWVLQQAVDPADPLAVAPLLDGLALDLRTTADGQAQIKINGHDVSTAIRSPEVTAVVSTVAAHACVRQSLTSLQRRLGEQGGLVAEGRDTGTAVFPDAECKIFLTATVAERARRRARDLELQGFTVPQLKELEHQIAERDRKDSTRSEAPLRQAPDALLLVTDGMEIGAVIQAMVDAFRSKVPEEAWPGSAPAPSTTGRAKA